MPDQYKDFHRRGAEGQRRLVLYLAVGPLRQAQSAARDRQIKTLFVGPQAMGVSEDPFTKGGHLCPDRPARDGIGA